ncbi:MAG TPA: MoaD/ThiS family protein [Anaerolineales bacterium]|nr:MoaD/ThiS family protein [Anaerolineales bacterium]
MATVWIPAALRPLTGGRATVSAPGGSIRDLIDNLEAAHPGLRARLLDGERLQPGLAVVVDGETSRLKLRQPVKDDSEVHFVAARSGG